ncbi:MAG: COR domain-containing protein, partial [Bacteroidota bacterium]
RLISERSFSFNDCPLVHPPIEILKEGNEAILNYFEQLEKDQGQELLEAKALLIGEGMSGKTSLRNRLLGRELPKEPDRTKGLEVEVEPYCFPLAEEKEMQLNLFDFGGQDHYKPLHQFFYSKRSLYLLLTKNGDDQNDFDFWLETAQLHGDNSPLIVINNLFGDVQCNFNLGKWAKDYPFVKESLEVNLGTDTDGGLDKVKRQIEAYAQTLPHIRQVVPKSWADIRAAVMERAKEENYITLNEYLKICRQNGIEERKRALLLSQYLHDIGVFFHFQENAALRRWVILRNEWATDAVYRILDDAQVRKQKGHFTQADYERIWSADEYIDMQDALLALMKEFRLCYPKPKGGEFIAPSILPIIAPEYDWSTDVEERTIRLEYKFMPRILFTQFLVTEHEKIENDRLCVWRTGAVFCKGDTRVEARQQGKNAIELRAQGSKMVELLTILNDTLDELHETTPGIEVERLIPCTCQKCLTSTSKPYIFKKSRLDHRLRHGRLKDECQDYFEEVSIPELIGNVLLPDYIKDQAERRERKAKSRTLKVFIASSEELAEERDELEMLIRRQNDDLLEKGIHLRPVRWEYFLDTISATSLQDEYNKEIKQCDIVICLFHTKVGQYTAKEFDTALGEFRNSGRPHILTYFKEAPVKPSQIKDSSLNDFKEKLQEIKHFWTTYESLGDLKLHFIEQLKKMNII